ncbi:hypothetical protein L2X99_02880 [Microbacterium sp. KUDC0406]|uniref:hypothetical protein n=1 Tax=Microbacterium sp. KUDC0406 TaxID=2909588 RepID=UPI001F4159C8|nr:hypothetical protein [Microbacterium sp. KUDC0406]UJP10635.1 hypothetical protein L2X99_02880 [Microbacterium sp. KUDC0406]
MSKRGWNASLPTRWLTDPTMADLSACEFATHARALMFGIEHETDGLIPTKALRLLLPADCALDEVVAGLIENAVWTTTATGFQIVDWAETQTTKAQMERTRKQGRERQRKFQANLKAEAQAANGVSDASVARTPEIRQDQTKPAKAGPRVESEKNDVLAPSVAVVDAVRSNWGAPR